MNYYPFHIGDYASATRHLSWLEDAAYRRLLDVYYIREEPLPTDMRQVYRLVVASNDEQREAVDVVLGEFFTLTEDGYRHERCDAEIYCANEKKNKASHSAQERWRIAREMERANQSENDSKANAMRTHEDDYANASKTPCEGNAPNPNPNPKVNLKTLKPTREPDGFAEFWSAYPKKVGKGAAEASWRKHRPPLQTVLDAVKRQAESDQWRKDGGQFIPNPATWLNQKRWEDDAQLSKVVKEPYTYPLDLNREELPAGWLPPPNGCTRYFPELGWLL